MRSNLPPGVTESMIIGCRPEDEAWDLLIDDIMADCEDAASARRRWENGVRLLGLLRDCGRTYRYGGKSVWHLNNCPGIYFGMGSCCQACRKAREALKGEG